MKPKKIIDGDLLFHAVHGLCRVERVIEQQQAGKKIKAYSIVPRVMSKMKVRFVVAVGDLEMAGFHRLISPKEAKKILNYLKAGDGSAVQTEPKWILARNILAFSADKLKTRDQRRRQMLEQSIKGLVGEFAFVFKVTLKEAAAKIEKSLGKLPKTVPLLQTVLADAAEG